MLDGNVQRSGQMIRVSVQLLRVSDGAPLWAERFDDFFTNVFQVQDSIAEKVSETLSMKLSANQHRQMIKRQTGNTEAYELYMRAKYLEMKRATPTNLQAIEIYQQAIGKDPEYTLAYAGLARIYMEIAMVDGSREATRRADVAAKRALALDIDLPEAHLAQGQVLIRGEWDWAGARREFERALELDPNSAYGHWARSTLLMALGEKENALKEMEKARRLDPGSQDMMDDLGWAYDCNRDFESAIRASKTAVEMDPLSITANHQLGKAYLHAKQYAEAKKQFETVLRSHLSKRGLADLGQLAAEMGDLSKARDILKELGQAQQQKPTYEFAYMRAVLQASLGDKDAAFKSLELAAAQRLSRVIWMAVDPDMDPLRNDPRFPALLRRLRLIS